MTITGRKSNGDKQVHVRQTGAKDDSESLSGVKELLVDLYEEVWQCGTI